MNIEEGGDAEALREALSLLVQPELQAVEEDLGPRATGRATTPTSKTTDSLQKIAHSGSRAPETTNRRSSKFYGRDDSSSDDEEEEAEAEAEEDEEDFSEKPRRRSHARYDEEEDEDEEEEEEEEDEAGGGDTEADDISSDDDDRGRSIFTFNKKKKRKPKLEEDEDVDSNEGGSGPWQFGDFDEDDSHTAGIDNALDAHTAGADPQTLKTMRLQRLLAKTDKIVDNINTSMAKFVEKEKESAAAIAAAAAAAAAADDNDAEDNHDADHSFSPLLLGSTQLRDYQTGGVEWLCSLHNQRLNGILADEMGLGKTLQVLAFLCALWERSGIWGPHLIVMPMSVLSSWRGDIERFCSAEGVDVHVHHGAKEERLQEFEAWRKRIYAAKSKKGQKQQRQWKVALVLTTYDLSIKDVGLFQKVGRGPCRWGYLVVDEAHRLKNRASILFDALQKTNAARRLLLTGTPLQNNLGELWSLLSFILPAIFNDIQQFADWFNRPFEFGDDDDAAEGDSLSSLDHPQNPDDPLSSEERGLIIASLHRVMKPFLLRRLKVDVVLDMPLKIERTVYCPFSGLQKQVFDVIKAYVEKQARKNGSSSSSSSGGGGDGDNDGTAASLGANIFNHSTGVSFNNVLMHLRKLCNHPFLVLEDMKSVPDDLYFKYLVSSSGKMCMLERLLKVLIPNGHRVLIFSQMTTTLDILQGYLSHTLGLGCCRLDGDTVRSARESQLEAFSAGSPDLPVFLLSTRAGGVGINLQAADTVIFYDSDWNPQQDLQAMSRAHRLGQTKTVLVLRLVSVGAEKGYPSVEERILRRAAHKLAAERVVLADGEFDMGTSGCNKMSATTFAAQDGGGSKDESLLSLFAAARDPSLDTDASECSGVTTQSSGTSSVSSSSGGENKPSELKVEQVKLEPQAIVAVCNRPLAASHESSISDRAFPDMCKLITNTCAEPLGPYGSDLEEVVDWSDWLGVPLGMEETVRKQRKRALKEQRRLHVGQGEGGEGGAEELQPAGKRAKLQLLEMATTPLQQQQPVELGDEDICVLCRKAWPPSAEEYATRFGRSPAAHSPHALSDSIRESTMILCDSCEGSYHMVCIDVYQMPPEGTEWLCQFCLSLKRGGK